jgi:hypothetical protein
VAHDLKPWMMICLMCMFAVVVVVVVVSTIRRRNDGESEAQPRSEGCLR